MITPTFAFGLTASSVVLLLIVGAVLFGKQLPTVGNWLGKTIKSVQDGLHGVENDLNPTAPHRDAITPEAPKPPQRIGAMTPKFDDKPAPPAPPQA